RQFTVAAAYFVGGGPRNPIHEDLLHTDRGRPRIKWNMKRINLHRSQRPPEPDLALRRFAAHRFDFREVNSFQGVNAVVEFADEVLAVAIGKIIEAAAVRLDDSGTARKPEIPKIIRHDGVDRGIGRGKMDDGDLVVPDSGQAGRAAQPQGSFAILNHAGDILVGNAFTHAPVLDFV